MRKSRRSFMQRLVAQSILLSGMPLAAPGRQPSIEPGESGIPSRSFEAVAVDSRGGKKHELPASKAFELPPPGTFAEFTLNTPADVGATAAILANWCGGTFVDDYGAGGAAVYHGGGEHFSWPDKGGVMVLDCARRAYSMRCLSSVTTHMGVAGKTGSSVNDWGCYVDNDYPQSKHTYNGLVPFPRAWGGGPMGGLIRIQSGGPLNAPIIDSADRKVNRTHGYTAAYAFDLSKLVDGHRRLSGDQTYDLGSGKPSTTNDAPGCGIDHLREGWWMFARTGAGAGNRMAFTHKSGKVENAATAAIALSWGRLHHFADDDTLVALANGGHLCHPGPRNPWQSINFRVASADQADWNPKLISHLGYIGFQWSQLLNCFIGADTTNNLPKTSVRIWKIIPPETAAKRWSDPWFVERERLGSADGSEIDMASDHAVNAGNGTAFGKLVECKALRSFVWTRRVDKKGQLLRAAGM